MVKKVILDDVVDGNYGSMACRQEEDRRYWDCFESSDYHFVGIVDDFGNIVMLEGTLTSLREY